MVSDVLITPPVDGWTTADLDAMPETNQRYELTDGALTVSPSPSNLHQWLAIDLCGALVDRSPEAYTVALEVEVRFTTQLTRIPDVLVVRTDEPGCHWFAPDEVLVAVEVESPGSRIEDRVTKPAIYAQHGIQHFWRVEQDPLQVVVHRLVSGDAYVAERPTDRLAVAEPFPVDVSLADLLPRWAR